MSADERVSFYWWNFRVAIIAILGYSFKIYFCKRNSKSFLWLDVVVVAHTWVQKSII